MMRKSLTFGMLFGAALAAGCSDDSKNTTTTPDSGTPTDGGGTTDGSNSSPDMATAAISGTKLTSGSYVLSGVTSDDQIIAGDAKTPGTYVAIPVGGGKPTLIDDKTAALTMHGKVVFTWNNVDQTTAVGSINAWSGSTTALGTAGIAGLASASADGQYVYYVDNANADGTSVDLYVAKADGSGKKKVLPGVSAGDKCSPYARFGADHRLVVASCPAGSMQTILNTIDPATGNIVTLDLDNGGWFSLSGDGTKILTATSKNAGEIFDTSAANPNGKVDADTGVTDGYFTPDGKAVVYITDAGDLKRGDLSGGFKATKLTTGATHLQRWFIAVAEQTLYPAISPDGKWVIFSKKFDEQSGMSDLYLASTTAPGTPVTLTADSDGAVFGDPFTGDSSKAVFYQGIAQVNGGALVGKLMTEPVAGGAATQLGKNVWVSYVAKSGNTVVFNDNYKSGKYNGRADIKFADVAGATPATFLAPQAEADIYLNTARDKAIFSVMTTGQPTGIYAADVK